MAVLVRKHPQHLYQTIGGVGLSQADREQADRLDGRLKSRLKKLVEELSAGRLMPKEKGKGSVLAYWELGRALREVTQSKDFPYMAELPLLWQNAKMHLPEPLLYKDRGPYREHLWYCYRLAQHPKELVRRMKWGEWVTIFDSAGINQEQRFDDWFGRKLCEQTEAPERQLIRKFAPCVNAMLGNIEVAELNEPELLNCYEAAWQLAVLWYSKASSAPTGAPDTATLKVAVTRQLLRLDDVMQGNLSPGDFAIEVFDVCSCN